MKHTAESLTAMSDFEVNKALAWLVMMVLKKETWTFNNDKDTVQFFNENTKKSRIVDYCNNPSDVMPLVFESKIGFAPNKDSYEAFHLADNFQIVDMQYVDTNPMRAAACCLILVLQEKKQ